MKKLISLLCAVAMLFACFGCSAKDPASSSPPPSPPTSSQEVPEKPALAFPEKNITVICPFGAGGGSDTSTRVLVQCVTSDMLNGHSMVTENMPGGGAVIGQTYVANTAAADGYTLMVYSTSAITNTILGEQTYDWSDFKPIVGFAQDPALLIVPANSPYNSLNDFFGAAKTETKFMATSGFSAGEHVRGLRLAEALDLNFDYLHFESAAIALAQVMGGQVDFQITSVSESIGAIESGEVKCLGIMSSERLEDLPDIPTFLEQGYEGWIDGSNRGIACHKDVPDDVYQWLVELFAKVCSSEEFIEKAKEIGFLPACQSPEVYQKWIETTVATYTELAPVLSQD